MCEGKSSCGRLTTKDIQKRIGVFSKKSIRKKLNDAKSLPEPEIITLDHGGFVRKYCSVHLVYIAKLAYTRLGVKVDSLD